MPPPGRSPQSNAGRNSAQIGEPYYSNEDVAILHDIVVLAQELLPTLPERERLPTNALFNAYYDILSRVGVNADHDSRYARVLFKIGGLRGPGSLYGKFEEVLSRMGIEIEFDRDEDEDDDQSSQQEESQNEVGDAAGEEDLGLQDIQDLPPRQGRRNSESTIWDVIPDAQPQSNRRRSSFADAPNKSKPNSQTHERPEQPARLPLSQIFNRASQEEQTDDNPTDKVRPWLESSIEPLPRRRRRSVSTHVSMRIHRRSSSARRRHQRPTPDRSAPPSDGYFVATEATAVTSVVEDCESSSPDQLPQLPVDHVNNSKIMDLKASLFFQHHISFLGRKYLIALRNTTFQLRQDRLEQRVVAIKHDQRILVKGAFSEWREKLHQKRRVTETKEFFSHLEKRASRARDLYLMHVAFTHWNACANEQIQRTALARRHIVRTKIFHAWREVTAVNELKVRRQVLKKFFGIWKREQTRNSESFVMAIQSYEENLVEKKFRLWVYKYLDERASVVWANGIKRRLLYRWIVVSHSTWEDQRIADEMRRYKLLRNVWMFWKAKTDEHIQQAQDAEAYYRAQLCRKPLRKWLIDTRFIPASNAVQKNLKTRLLLGSFVKWHGRARQEKQAAELDRLKIVREAWTNWLHKSRTKIMVARVNDRVLSQAIYKWTLATRCAGQVREVTVQVKNQKMYTWFAQSLAGQHRQLDQENVARCHTAQKTKHKVLKTWATHAGYQKQLKNVAVDFYAPRILSRILSKLSECARHVDRLQTLSNDAGFYLLAARSIKKWKASTESMKREKRKMAYVQVRRMVKMNLARRLLHSWKHQAHNARDLLYQAQQMSQNRNIIVGMNAFDRWRGRAEELTEMDSVVQEIVLRKHFMLWKVRSNSYLELRIEAIVCHQEHQQTRAVKKWSLQSLQIGAQTNYALEIREKNARRNFRKIFRYWQQRTAQRRPVEEKASYQPSSTTQAEAWSDFGEDVDGDEWVGDVDEPIALTPLPGYLNTPSKRTERITAAAARFSTTPKAPLSTPFERQLRAQYSNGMPVSLRRPPNKSRLGMSSGFTDIPK